MNRLQFETSPYLLQHARNPVDWYAWKPEAFERAKKENKPILVSIGYSTCHWCHVMEHESFENPDIAAYMNEHFVNIKVDREERPDVDAIYMDACQILSGSGGWPLNCFLTPDGRPFYAGTYYPPRPAYNRPSWLQVIQHMAKTWDLERDKVYEQAERLMGYIRRNDRLMFNTEIGPGEKSMEVDAGAKMFAHMRTQFDRVEGGFGGAPKFPSTMAIQYLLQYFWFFRDAEALEHALLSLDKMIMGGIYDHLGGGFARYATDRAWRVPHFEKMLYDNALLMSAVSAAVRLLRSQPGLASVHRERIAEYEAVLAQCLGYLQREMTHPEGGFFSAQDADSEGEEGKFYVWQKAETDALLGEIAPLFAAYYGISETGNWEHTNILYRTNTEEAFARMQGMDPEAVKTKLAAARSVLFEARRQRIPPGLDDKVLTGWNALMISGLTDAFTATGNQEFLSAAVGAMEFLLTRLTDPQERGWLWHTWKEGRVQYPGFLDDYAFTIAALLDLYEVTFRQDYLDAARVFTDYTVAYFWAEENRLFYFTREGQDDVVVRKTDVYDNATPSGNSTMAVNLRRLSVLLHRPDWRQMHDNMLHAISESVLKYPLSFERWAGAILNNVKGVHEIAVLGDNALDKAAAINRLYVPNKVLVADRIENQKIPLLENKTGASDALIYVCKDFACQRPVSRLEEFIALVSPADDL